MKKPPSIVLLHATPVAMQPTREAFVTEWPEALVSDLLDEGLTIARAKSGPLTEDLIERFVKLARYGCESGADGILITCSAFGPAIERAAGDLPIPVIKPNEAMFRASISCGNRVAMLATFAPSVPTMVTEFEETAESIGSSAKLTSIVVEGAMDALRNGGVDTHNQLIAERAKSLSGFDAIVLAHFSTSQAASAVKTVTSIPLFTAPESAVRQLRHRMEGQR